MPLKLDLGKTVEMRWNLGDAPLALRRRIVAGITTLLLVVLVLAPASVGAQTPAPEGDECQSIPGTVQEIEGEVVDRSVLVDEFSTNIHLFTVAGPDETSQIEVDGSPELVEVGTTYRFTTISVFSADGTTASLLSSAFGDNLSCLTEEDPDDPEADPIEVRNGIATVDADGEATLIEQPPLLPTPPISARSFFIGFGIFALIVFMGSKFVR